MFVNSKHSNNCLSICPWRTALKWLNTFHKEQQKLFDSNVFHTPWTWAKWMFSMYLSQVMMSKHFAAAAAAANSLQSCRTLCDPIDSSPPGSRVPGILQARILEWVAVSFSNPWKWKVKVKSLSRVWLLATPWTAAYQAPLSMGFSRQEYWSGVPW